MQTQVSKDDQASTAWCEERGGFVVALPRRQLVHPAQLFPLFKSEVRNCFADDKQLPPYSMSPADEWADVEMEARAARLSLGGGRQAVAPSGPPQPPDFIPRADAMPRPDDLLLKPPYHLIVNSRSVHEIEIQCGHSATLKFLADYFKRWRRVNHQVGTKVRTERIPPPFHPPSPPPLVCNCRPSLPFC